MRLSSCLSVLVSTSSLRRRLLKQLPSCCNPIQPLPVYQGLPRTLLRVLLVHSKLDLHCQQRAVMQRIQIQIHVDSSLSRIHLILNKSSAKFGPSGGKVPLLVVDANRFDRRRAILFANDNAVRKILSAQALTDCIPR